MTEASGVFTERDRLVIAELAAGNQERRPEAISIFRAKLRDPKIRGDKGQRYSDPFFAFMSEVDNPCPCWVLRSQSRAKILGKAWP
jgi:hypothetical protein